MVIVEEVLDMDLQQLMQIENAVFNQDAFSKRLMKMLIRNHLIFHTIKLTEDPKEIMGFIIVIKENADSANIINIAIRPSEQNKHYGSTLLQYTIQQLSTMKKITKIHLNVKTNNIPALKLYKKFNFVVLKEIENYYRNGESAFLMELQL